MKNMRLLLFSSVIITISAIAWAFYYDYKTKLRLVHYAEVPVSENDSDVEAQVIDANGEYYYPDAEAQAETDFFLDGRRPEEGALYSVEKDLDSSVVPPLPDDPTLSGAEEVCCPEEGVLEEKTSHYDRVRAKLIAIRGDVPEVEAFIALGKKMSNREMLTKDESLEHFRLMAFFHPSEGNIAAYEKWKEFHSVGDPDSYTMEYIDPPQGRLDTPPE